MIEREPLLTTLQQLKPALASKDIIEELTNIWFTGTQAIASNDTGFGICVPCELEDFVGGLKGSLLLGLLAASKAKELELIPVDNKNDYAIKFGKTRLQLATFPIEQMMAELPTDKKDKSFKIPVELGIALGKVLISAGNVNSSVPEQTGITLIKKNGIHVFACDDMTISWVVCASIDIPIKEGRNIIIPTVFVDQLLKMNRNKNTRLYIGKDSIYAKNENMTIFGRLIGTEEPTDLIQICKDMVKECNTISIPARLKFALARTFVMLDKQKDGFVNLLIKNNTLRIKTTSALGNLKDTMTLEGDHPEASINLDPKLIKRALPMCQSMALTGKAMVLTQKDFTYMIAEHS